MKRTRLDQSFIDSRSPEQVGNVELLRAMTLREGVIVVDLDDPEAKRLFDLVWDAPAEQPSPTAMKVSRSTMEIRGPALWAMFHNWALAVELGGPRGTLDAVEWLNNFSRQLPCGDCLQDWARIASTNPPDFSSNEALFAWTVDRHNDVNRRLGKPVLALADAIARYRQAADGSSKPVQTAVER